MTIHVSVCGLCIGCCASCHCESHGLQTGMGPGVIVLQEKGCLLLWPDSGKSSLQLSQRREVAVRFDGLSGFKEIQKDHPFSIPKHSEHHFTR